MKQKLLGLNSGIDKCLKRHFFVGNISLVGFFGTSGACYLQPFCRDLLDFGENQVMRAIHVHTAYPGKDFRRNSSFLGLLFPWGLNSYELKGVTDSLWTKENPTFLQTNQDS